MEGIDSIPEKEITHTHDKQEQSRGRRERESGRRKRERENENEIGESGSSLSRIQPLRKSEGSSD